MLCVTQGVSLPPKTDPHISLVHLDAHTEHQALEDLAVFVCNIAKNKLGDRLKTWYIERSNAAVKVITRLFLSLARHLRHCCHFFYKIMLARRRAPNSGSEL
jgi:hypothetical protein